MRLKSFQVKKFRNIVDSGNIEIEDYVTCLVGKNESGKSALLEALYLLNPAYGEEFNVGDQYPRWLAVADRRQADLNEISPIRVTLELDGDDCGEIFTILGEEILRSLEITVTKQYGGNLNWTFNWPKESVVKYLLSEFPNSVKAAVNDQDSLEGLREALESLVPVEGDSGPSEEDIASANEALMDKGLHDTSVDARLLEILEPKLPQFFRFTEYSTLPGRIDFNELTTEQLNGPGRTGIQTARALLQLAGTNLDQLQNDDYELRRGELDAVQIDLTNQVFEYWKQNPDLQVAIDVDKETVRDSYGHAAVARFLEIRLSDKRTGYSNNFSQRSSGFQWFFSFLAAFSEFDRQNAPVVLLDEPALSLHGRAQADFLRFINERLAPESPVIYTTHSPFMVEAGRLGRVRIVEDKGPPVGATATKEVLVADADSLFPLQAALGYDIAQSLFIGPNNLVVEGTSDYIYLTIMSQLCGAAERSKLDERWRILPAGGATNIATFVSLIGPHLDITVLADSGTKGMQRVTGMVDHGLLAGHRLILANSATASRNADIEDLFSEGDYLKLFNKTFGTSLKVKDLPPGDRIVKRLESKQGSYVHGEVAETLLRNYSGIEFANETLDRFAKLNSLLNSTMESNA